MAINDFTGKNFANTDNNANNYPMMSPPQTIQPNQPNQFNQPNQLNQPTQPYQPYQPYQAYLTNQPNQFYQPNQPSQFGQPNQLNQLAHTALLNEIFSSIVNDPESLSSIAVLETMIAQSESLKMKIAEELKSRRSYALKAAIKLITLFELTQVELFNNETNL